jgi:hypothetical protein
MSHELFFFLKNNNNLLKKEKNALFSSLLSEKNLTEVTYHGYLGNWSPREKILFLTPLLTIHPSIHGRYCWFRLAPRVN